MSQAWSNAALACRTCAVMEELWCQVQELWEEVSIREDQREIDRIFPKTQHIEKPHTPSVEQKQSVSTPTINPSENSGKGGGWKLLTTGMKRKSPASRSCLQLQNRVTVLKVKEKPDVPISKEPGPPKTKLCKTNRKKWWVRMGEYFLQGAEAVVCWHNQSSGEVSCLSGTRIHDILERLPKVTWLSDYYTPCSYSI